MRAPAPVRRLTWGLYRVGAMTPGEAVHRAGNAMRDRWRRPEYARWTPEQAAARFFPAGLEAALAASRLGALVPPSAAARDEALVREAAGIAAGRWTVFGHEVRLDDPPRWRRNYASGAEWPDVASAAIDYRDARAGDPKFTWELGRLTMLPTLALAWRMTGERAYAQRAARWLADFTRQNPLGRGIHQTSGIEMAVRVITATWTLALLAGSAEEAALGPALGLVVQQALHCRDHLSLGSSANNHLIAEYAAMTVVGALFPALAGADALLDRGVAGLEHETLRQIHPDGVPVEQAFGYLPFVWELLLAGFAAAEAAGRRAAEPVRDRLVNSLDFARTVRLPDGTMPRIGDEDDGQILLAGGGVSRLDRAGAALAAWLGVEAPGADVALARLLFGSAPAEARAVDPGMHAFPLGGYTVWRTGDLLVTFDHGPLGLAPIAAHGHADALAVTLYAGGTPIVIDPGTLAYFGDDEARARTRGTPGHATVRFGRGSQSRMLGPFLWGARARVHARGSGFECRWVGGARHLRREIADATSLTLDDEVDGPDAALDFMLAPGAQVALEGRIAIVRIGDVTTRFECEGAGPWQLEPAECALGFARRVPTVTLTAPIAGAKCRTQIRIER